MSEKYVVTSGPLASDRHAAPRICRTMREAIFSSAHGYSSIKELAGELDMSPSNASACTILGEGDHVRPFPAEKLADLCRVTENASPLFTLADQLGFAVIRREDLDALDRHVRTLRGER